MYLHPQHIMQTDRNCCVITLAPIASWRAWIDEMPSNRTWPFYDGASVGKRTRVSLVSVCMSVRLSRGLYTQINSPNGSTWRPVHVPFPMDLLKLKVVACSSLSRLNVAACAAVYRSCGSRDAKILSFRRHRQYGFTHGIDWRRFGQFLLIGSPEVLIGLRTEF